MVNTKGRAPTRGVRQPRATDEGREKARQYKVISLFSGAMGLDLGIGRTGRFRPLACVDRSPACVATIEANKGKGHLPEDVRVIGDDIRSLDPRELMEELGLRPGELDLLIGGPPCQAFSTAGRRGTVQDARGTLIWDFLRFVEVLRPKFFVMENVRGLLSAALRHRPLAERPDKGGPSLEDDEKPGSVVRLFARDLDRLPEKYHLDVFEVNAVNYGAPQIRERVLFIGNRFAREVDFPEPTHGKPGGEEGLEPWRTLGDALQGLREKDPLVLDFSPRKKAYLDLVPPGSNWRSLPPEVQREAMGRAYSAKGGRSGWWRRLSFDLPCPTLLTMPNHAGTALCHPTKTRALTLREYARVQEFPDDWEFRGSVQEQYVQVGNAVPLRLGEVAGETVARHLDALEEAAAEGRPLKGEANGYRVVYVRAHIRTRRWYKEGKVVVRTRKNPEKSDYGRSRTLRSEKSLL